MGYHGRVSFVCCDFIIANEEIPVMHVFEFPRLISMELMQSHCGPNSSASNQEAFGYIILVSRQNDTAPSLNRLNFQELYSI